MKMQTSEPTLFKDREEWAAVILEGHPLASIGKVDDCEEIIEYYASLPDQESEESFIGYWYGDEGIIGEPDQVRTWFDSHVACKVKPGKME